MSTTREMHGIADMTGEKIGTLRINRIVARRPETRYAVICERCGTESTASHTRLRNGAAKCQNSGCGKQSAPRGRDLLTEQRRQIAERENQRRADELAASAARMAAETEGWERPTKYTPNPEPYQPMSERDRLALRERREQEQAERLEAERPAREKAERHQQRIAELRAEHDQTLRQIHAIQRERIATDKDDEFVIDPATTNGPGVPVDQVTAWHAAQFAEFQKQNPDYYRCDENSTALVDYIERNAPGLRLISALQLTAAFKRLSDYRLLKQRPAPQPEPVERPQRVNLMITREPSKPVAKSNVGKDQLTGEMREFSDWEIRNMSADEYKRTFGTLQSVAELFTALAGERRQ